MMTFKRTFINYNAPRTIKATDVFRSRDLNRAKEIRQLARDGMNKAQIADALGIDESAVRHYCKRYDIQIQPK